MRVAVSVLASVVLSGAATAAPVQYAVDDLVVGTQLNLGGASYREYKCTPSEQFAGLTWCQKARAEKGGGKPYTAGYSLLHGTDGNIVYVNRSQDPASITSKQAHEAIARYSSKIGSSPRIMNMPHRAGGPDGMIAIWGDVTLVPLDQESVTIVSRGGSPKKGLLIDFQSNFVRSARQGLPVYRITGGPGFVWTASFDQKGRGTLRMAAVDASALVAPEPQAGSEPQPSSEPQPASQPEVISDMQPASEPEPSAEAPEDAQLAPSPQPVAAQAPEEAADPKPQQVEASPVIENLERQLASASAAIAELEKAKSAAEAARRASEQARATEKAKLDKRIAQLEAAVAPAVHPKANRWENALYGSAGGLFIVLVGSALGFFWKRYTARGSEQPMSAPVDSAEVATATEGEPFVASPALAIAEDAFGRELDQQVAALNLSNEVAAESPAAGEQPVAAETTASEPAKVEEGGELAPIARVSDCASQLKLACQTQAPPSLATVRL